MQPTSSLTQSVNLTGPVTNLQIDLYATRPIVT